MPAGTITASELDRLLSARSGTTGEANSASNSPFFKLLLSTGRSQLQQLFRERQCRPGEFIVRENEVGDSMYLIWSGQVAVVKGDLNAPTLLGYRGPGEIIGEMALLDNRPRSASVVALGPVRLLRLQRQDFQQWLNANPAASQQVMEMLSARLRTSDDNRSEVTRREKYLVAQVDELASEKQHLEELQRLRQETADLLVHDLRNPLSMISTVLQMLEMVLPPEVLEQNLEMLRIAERGCERMLSMVQSLLDGAQIESGEAQLDLVPVDVAGLIQEVLARAGLVNQKGIRFVNQAAAGLPRVEMDRGRIERVLTNLVDNANKYAPDGGQIGVGARVEGGILQVFVNDDGPGVPEADRERIFDRFAQGAGEKKKRRGFGLGLSYCRLAVEAHGGRIWVETGEGGAGSRFVFTLPVRRGSGG